MRYDATREMITTDDGHALYFADDLDDLSEAARVRLAELLDADPDLHWLACEDVLRREGLYPQDGIS